MKPIIKLLVLLSLLSSCASSGEKKSAAAESGNIQVAVNQVVGIGKIEPEMEITQLSSPVSGIVQVILKQENDTVTVGAPILELDHRLEDVKVQQLLSEINTQIQQIRVDEATVTEYEAKYNNGLLAVQRQERLLTKGAETQQAVDDATANIKSLQSNLNRAKATVAVSNSRLYETKARLLLAQVERNQKIIKSPINGKILEISTLVGSAVDTRIAFAQISPLGKTIAVCEIDELYANKVMVGQNAWIRYVGSQDTLSLGTVYQALSFLKKKSLFTDQSGEKEDRRVRTIKIMLHQPDGLLLNARVECVVDISGNLKK
jgi:HlyD family secretion protein